MSNNPYSLIQESDSENEFDTDTVVSSSVTPKLINDIKYKTIPDRIAYDSLLSNIIDSNHDYFTTSLIAEEYNKENLGLVLTDEYPETAFVDINNGNLFPQLTDTDISSSNLKIEYNYPNHWGQRKLLLLEINFLTKVYKDEEILVIYAGAAPGTHLPMLVKLFPKVQFHLYDPKRFDNCLEQYSNVKINPYYVSNNMNYKNKKYGYFTNEVAKWYENKNKFYFISDIRTVPHNIFHNNKNVVEKFEKEILRNQNDQMNWISIMKPELSILKFKLPYPSIGKDQYYKYLRGEIQFQVWSPTSSSETRIVISKSDLDYTYWYDVVAYERKLAYYNYTRQIEMNDKVIDFVENKPTLKEFWSNLVENIPNFTLDFYNELLLLKDYHEKFGKGIKLETFLNEIIVEITTLLNIVYSENKDNSSKFFRLRKTTNDID